MKKTNKKIILDILKKQGYVSNYYLINNKITTRASEYIRQLREEGYDIETVMKGKECIYRLKSIKEQVVEYIDKDTVRIKTVDKQLEAYI